MIVELYTSVVCFGIKVITKNKALFQFCTYFVILAFLNQEKVLTLSYHLQASFINKEALLLALLNCKRFIFKRNAYFQGFGFHIKAFITLQFLKLHDCTSKFLQKKNQKILTALLILYSQIWFEINFGVLEDELFHQQRF